MADPPPRPTPAPPPPATAPLPAPPHAPLPAPLPAPPACERVPITVNLDRAKSEDEPRAAEPDQCYVRNSSFLSRDIEAKAKAEVKKGKESPPVKSPPKKVSPPVKAASPPVKAASPPVNAVSPPLKAASPPKTSPPKAAAAKAIPPPDVIAQPKRAAIAPPKRESSLENATAFPPKTDLTQKKESTSPPKHQIPPQPKSQVTSPPMTSVKLNRSDSKGEENPPQPLKILKKESSFAKETVVKSEKLSLVNEDLSKSENKNEDNEKPVANSVEKQKSEESNGVGDKIKKFEKAAEDASANVTVGRLSRAGSVRRGRTERLGSDGKDDLPPPATPFKDNVHFDLAHATNAQPERSTPAIEWQQSLNKNGGHSNAVKWQRSESSSIEVEKVKPEPQKIIKPEFKPLASPLDATIRSPSLGAKLPDHFPSHGTAFRNVAPDQTRPPPPDDANSHNHFKPCKFKNKEKYSVSKGSSYFTRGSEEIWLVKKKDIEEIEERVLDSFRRAGGNMCMRSESMRPASDSGQGVSFTHATMGRNKRQMYARSESLDPQWAGARAQTLKRQSSVACTCGHDKKTRAKSAGADTPPRPRSRSHGDDNNHQHVLDKYETLV